MTLGIWFFIAYHLVKLFMVAKAGANSKCSDYLFTYILHSCKSPTESSLSAAGQ